MDPLVALSELPGVDTAVAQARAAVDEVLWPRNLGSDGPALAVASRLHGAQACAALEGVDFAVEAWRSGDAFDDSPMGLTAAGVWRGYSELSTLVPTWRSAPLQALARLHVLVAGDQESESTLGRPRSGDASDSLLIGAAPPPAEVAARLSLLGRLVGTGGSAPAIVEAAVVQGEILALRPFAVGSPAIAQMATRLVLAARGLDPDLLVVPEVGVLRAGRPAYVRAVRGYLSGDPQAVAQWVQFVAGTVADGAGAAGELLAEIRALPLGKRPASE